MKQNGSDISPRSMKKAKLLTTSQEKTADSESSYNAQKCGMDANQGWGGVGFEIQCAWIKTSPVAWASYFTFFPLFSDPLWFIFKKGRAHCS